MKDKLCSQSPEPQTPLPRWDGFPCRVRCCGNTTYSGASPLTVSFGFTLPGGILTNDFTSGPANPFSAGRLLCHEQVAPAVSGIPNRLTDITARSFPQTGPPRRARRLPLKMRPPRAHPSARAVSAAALLAPAPLGFSQRRFFPCFPSLWEHPQVLMLLPWRGSWGVSALFIALAVCWGLHWAKLGWRKGQALSLCLNQGACYSEFLAKPGVFLQKSVLFPFPGRAGSSPVAHLLPGQLCRGIFQV